MLITYEAQLVKKEALTHDVYLFSFTFPTEPGWDFKAGQYMIFHIPQADGHAARRLYSIASSPHQKNTLDFIIEILPNGIGSQHLVNMNIGDSQTLQGPAGLFFYKPTDRDAICLATGTGVAPIYSMLETHLAEFPEKQFSLFWGLKYSQDAYYLPELKALVDQHPNFHLSLCLSQEAQITETMKEMAVYCMSGRVTVGFEALLKLKTTQPQAYDYYVCGGKNVIDSLKTYLEEKQVPKEQVHFEKFTT
ncbi:MAG: ferredoxin--NADP reductase [Weeksellaceae bacterium]